MVRNNNTSSNIVEKGRNAEYFCLTVLFRLLLDYSYYRVISTSYGYMGFQKDVHIGLMVFSWLLLIGGALVIYRSYNNITDKLSNEILFLLFFMSFIPFSSMIGFGALELRYCISNIIYWILLVVFVTRVNWDIFGLSIKRIRFGNKYIIGDSEIILLSIVFGIVILYISGRYANFRVNFNLLEVYDFRAESKANALPTVLLYLFSWSRSVNTILVAYFIKQKKTIWAIFSILVQILSFGYDGAKSTLFLLIIAILVNLLPSFRMRDLNKWLLRGVVAAVALCLIYYVFTKNYVLISVLVRRVFYLPVRISKDYFSFFSTNSPDYFRQSILRHVGLKSEYTLAIPNMMGGLIFNSTGTSANNGLLSDAMANLGYAGIVVFPILISIVFRILDKCARGLDARLYATVAIYLALSLTNSFLFTILMTHGLIVTMIVLGMMKRDPN